MQKIKVLFLCVHNSARSQMAEAFLESLADNRFEVQSAGIEPGELNPLVVEVMKEEGIDISHKRCKAVFDIYRQGWVFSYVIAVCDEEAAERCPIFPGVAKRLRWSFPDPLAVQGCQEEKLAQVRNIRDAIKRQIEAWAATFTDEAGN